MSKTTLDSIILQYRAELNQGLNELAGHGTPEEQMKRAILRWVADEVIGNNGKLKRVKNAYRRDISGYTESMTKVSLEDGRSRNRLRNEQRKILAKHGYKGYNQAIDQFEQNLLKALEEV